MKTVKTTVDVFQCSFCDYQNEDDDDIKEHEQYHEFIDGVKVGDVIDFPVMESYSEWGRGEDYFIKMYKGEVVHIQKSKEDIAYDSYLIETDDGARSWVEVYWIIQNRIKT